MNRERKKLLNELSPLGVASFELRKIFIADSFTGPVVTVKDMVYHDIYYTESNNE